MFCNKCGSKIQLDKKESDFKEYPILYFCDNKHTTISREIEECPKGYKEIRALDSNGYQTCHIPENWKEKDYKDKNFHSVNLAVALWEKSIEGQEYLSKINKPS